MIYLIDMYYLFNIKKSLHEKTFGYEASSLHSPNLLPSKDQCPDWDPIAPPPGPGLPCPPRCARAWALCPRCSAPWPRARAASAPRRPPGLTGRRCPRQRSSRGKNSRSFPSDIGHFGNIHRPG